MSRPRLRLPISRVRPGALLALASLLLLAPGELASTNAPARPGAGAERGTDDPTEVGWRLLATLDYRSGEAPEELASLDGTLVKVPGFVVPLEDWASVVSEFLLVPYVGACIHTPPPPPNQLVYVKMEDGKRASYDGWSPVWVEGTLRIENTQSVYGATGFRIEGVTVRPYE